MADAIRKVIASCNLIRYKAKQKEKKTKINVLQLSGLKHLVMTVLTYARR